MRKICLLLTTLISGAFGTPAMAQTALDFDNVFYGPYDYTNPQHVRDYLPVVELYHFNSDIENLRGSIDQNAVAGHIMYVIRSFPNHHRALISATKVWERDGTPANPPRGVGRNQTPDFLYKRAIDFAPNDGVVRLLYGIYLVDSGRESEALTLLDQAAVLAPDTADNHYNLGLMYLRIGVKDKAETHASKAYKLGHPLPGLRKKMVAAGIWTE